MPWVSNYADKVLLLLFALIIIGVPLLLDQHADQLWQSTLISSLLAVLLYFVFLAQIKKRERSIREQAIQDIRRMLRDVVNNKLSVIMINGWDSISRINKEIEEYMAKKEITSLDEIRGKALEYVTHPDEIIRWSGEPKSGPRNDWK